MAQPTRYSNNTNRYSFGSFETLYNGKNNGGGNPYHDAEGKFTTGPGTAFGDYAYEKSSDDAYGMGLDTEDYGFASKIRMDTSSNPPVPVAMVEAYLEPEQIKGLMETNIAMEKASKLRLVEDMAKDSGDSSRLVEVGDGLWKDETSPMAKQALNIEEYMADIASDISDYCKQVQLASQWGGASKTTAENITKEDKVRIEKSLKRATEEVKKFSSSPAVDDKYKKGLTNLLGAIQAGYNTTKYVESKIDWNGKSSNVNVSDLIDTDKLMSKHLR